MAWTLEEIQAKRKQVEAKKAAMGTANAAAAVKTPSVSPGGLDSSLGEGAFAQKGTESVSQSAGGGWTLEEIQQKRKQVEAKKAAMASPDAKGNNALVNPDTVGKNVLDGMMGTPTGSAVQTDRQEDYEPGWVDVSDGANTPKQRAIAQGEYGKYAKTAQEVGEALTARRQEEQFDKLNAWMESDPGNRELVRKLRTGKVTPYAEQSHAMQPVSVSGAKLPQSPDGDSSLGEGAFSQYSDAELMAMGYTSDQIAQAKQYITDFDALPAWKRAAQRAVDSAEGVVSTVASAIPLAGEYAVQGVKNAAGSAKNLTGLYDELGADPRQKKLFDYLSGEGFSDEVIRQQGYTQSEIDAMRERISGAYATGGIDPETSLGYQIAQHGQGMNELAQRGLSDTSKFWLGAATSAGENLAIAAANPAAVLPVLTAQTVGDSLAESTAAGEDAGKALARAAAKGGVSWGIEQFGVEKMLDQMGAEKTVSRVAKQLLEKLEDNQLAKTAPHLYELVSSAGEEALEEFTETYADALVDALVDGDAESWARLASSETLAEAAQSALGGAAGGLLISAGAQGMGAMQKLPQSPAGDSSLGEGAFDEKATLAENEKAPAGEQAVQEKLPQSADADSAPPFVANATSSPGAGEVFGAEGELSSVEKAVENVESVESVEEDGKPSQLQALSAAQSADGGVAGSSPEGRAKNQGSTKGEPGVEEVTLAGNEKAPAGEQAVQESTGSSSAQNPTTNMTPGGEKVKGESYADLDLKADAQSLNAEGWDRAEQMDAARQLVSNARMSSAGVQTVVNNMPQGVGAAIYAPAAASLYRLGVVEDVASFDEALRLTGAGGVSGRVQQVLALGETGRKALQIAFLQGKGEAEQYRATKAAELGARPGAEALREDAGTFIKNGKLSEGKSRRDALIELTAKGTGVAAEQKAQLHGNAKGVIQTAVGKVFYSQNADAATILHETLHEVNSWSNETGQELLDTFHRYLVQQNGMDSVQELLQGYMDRYERAGQRLSYNQALEEATADAMQTIFGTEESFRNFVRLQAAEARMNAVAQQRTDGVMAKIETLLKKVLTDLKSFLGMDPDNAAAKAAKSLTEQQLRDLQELYFAHQIEAGANYRAALEEAGGMKKAASAQDTAAESKYQIDEGFERAINELDPESEKRYDIRVGTTSEVLKSIGVKDTEIVWKAEKLRAILRKHSLRNHNTVTGKGSVMDKETLKKIPQVLENPIIVLHSDRSQGADYESRIFMYGDIVDAKNKPVNVSLELLPTNKNGLLVDNIVVLSAYGHEPYGVGNIVNDEILYVDPNAKRTTAWLRGNRLQLPFSPTNGGVKAILQYSKNGVKQVTSKPLHGSRLYHLQGITQGQADILYPQGRYQLDVDEVDVDAAREQSVGDGGAETKTIQTVMEMAENAKVSEESLGALAKKLVKRTASRADVALVTRRLAALNDYLAAGKVDWAVAHSIMLDISQTVMEQSAKRNDELWKQYPDLHKMSMQIEKGSSDYEEIVYRWGSWGEARKELARHGVKLTLTKDGAASRWDADFTELQKIGEGLLPAEVPNSAADALDAMAAAHDAIRPTMESAYDTDWDAAKQEIAMQLWGDYLGMPGIANAANAKARTEFAKQADALNRQAKDHTIELTIKAKLAAENARAAQNKDKQYAWDDLAKANGGKENYHRQLALGTFGTTEDFAKAAYILPDGKMLDFAQGTDSRGLDHRNI